MKKKLFTSSSQNLNNIISVSYQRYLKYQIALTTFQISSKCVNRFQWISFSNSVINTDFCLEFYFILVLVLDFCQSFHFLIYANSYGHYFEKYITTEKSNSTSSDQCVLVVCHCIKPHLCPLFVTTWDMLCF